MAISTGALGAGNVTTTRAATFIPQLWSNEVVVTFKRATVMANLVKRLSVKGQRGSVINIPAPIRGQANAKTQGSQVTLMFATESSVVVTINKWFEYTRVIEDIVGIQALTSLRQFYTDDAGYALARQKDVDLFQLGRLFNGGAGTAAYATGLIAGDGNTAYTSGSPNSSALTDAGIRAVIQKLDNNDIPQDGRVFVMPPSGRNTIMGINRFTEQAFVGEVGQSNTLRNGRLGNIYGMDTYVSVNVDTATGAARAALMFHRDALLLAEQTSVRTQTQYKQEYLADMFTADTLYGVQALRYGQTSDIPTGGYALMMP